MDVEFSIPLNKEDLLSNNSDGYSVKNIIEPASIDEKLEDCNVDYRNEGPTAILKHFDTFYSVLHHMGRLKDEIKANTWEIVMSNIIIHINSLPMLLDPEGIDVQTQRQQLCTLKMESYILTQLMEAFESDATKPVITDAAKKGKSNKKKSHENWDWNTERNRALTAINQLIQLEIQRLWDPPIVEEEYTNLFSGVCYKLLENQPFVRQKEDRDVVFQILGHLIKRFNHQLGASLKIIQLLQHFEYLVSPLAQALGTFVIDFGAKNLVGDIIREIGRMDASDLSRDTSGTRSFSQFIVEIADKMPSYVLPNISLLMSHLDGDSYTMRNGVLGVFGEIVIKVLSKEDLDDNMKKSRESFLDRLEDHIHDVHAFVRSKDLQIWLHICQEKSIPISRQARIVDLVIGRLHDKSSQVRKYAVQFLKVCLIGNPFAAKLPMEQLTSSLEKEIEKLKEMNPEKDSHDETVVNNSNKECSDEWLKIIDDIKKALEEHFSDNKMDQTLEEIELYEDDGDALDKAILQIQKYLKDNEYKNGIRHLIAAMETWSDCEDFHVDQKDIENDDIPTGAEETADKTLTEDPSTPKGEEHTDSDALMKKCFVLLKKIFHVSSNTADEEDMELDLEAATQVEQPEANPVLNAELEKQKVLVKYLQDCVQFAQQMRRAIPILCQLLGSKANSDVLETIDFFIAAHEFGLTQSEEGIRRMANLIWSRDPIVKKAVVGAFERLYIDVSCDGERNKANLIVKSLMSLITKANLGELTSLEELLCELMKMDLIPSSVTQLLWQQFALKIPLTTHEEQRGSLIILSMIAGAEKDIIKSNLGVLVEHGLTYNKNYLLARDTCAAILKLTAKSKKFGSSSVEPFRLASDHDLFSRLEELLTQGLTNISDMSWTPFCEQALTVIFHLAELPDQICGRIVKCMTKTLMGGMEVDQVEEEPENDDIFPKASQTSGYKAHPRIVARVLSAAGHIALLELFHLDVSVFGELKRRHRVREEEKEKKGQKTKKTPGRSNGRDSSASTINSKGDTGVEDELGVGGAVAEDAEAEYIRKVCEHEIVTGQNLLSIFAPVAVLICSNPTKYKNVELQSAASLALSKFMLVSSDFCDQHLRLLFTILEKSDLPAVRSNAIITLGDLTFRFPNLIEPWTPHLYARLRDPSVEVRKTAVTILTHLILNDMVKVKGQISEMAVCLEDKEEKIASSAKMFFFELAQKGNALYNIAPDIISRLSDPDSGVDEKTFRTIMKYLLQFIQKDKQAESLVEKLCHRFRATRTDRQWRDLSYCLSVLPYNEKAFKKLMENVRCYHDKLSDEEVFTCFNNIITKSKKFAKVELKTLVEEFEVTLNAFHTRGAEENADFDKAAKALSLAASQTNTRNATEPAARRKKKASSRSKKKAWEVEDSDEDGEDMGKENTPLPGRGKRKNLTRGKKTVARVNPTFSSDDDMFE